MITIDNLTFFYNKELILDDISFKVDDGSIIAILGENGVGKTTLLKCISGILPLSKGSIKVDDIELTKINNKQRATLISYVPQVITFDDFNVFDAILMGRIPYIDFQAKHTDLFKTATLIEKMDLSSIALKKVNELSGGQRQKVAIARALVQDTKVMLFDEPTSNLDLKNQLAIIKTLKAIAKTGKIVMVTMHDISMALLLADKFLFLKDQKIYAYGDKTIISKDLLKAIYHIDVNVLNINEQTIINLGSENSEKDN